MRPRVMFLDQGLNGGGAERVMCSIMRGLDPREVEAELVVVDRLGALSHLVPDFIEVRELSSSRTSRALVKLVRALWVSRPDVVFASTEHVSVLAALARLLSPRHRLIARCPIMPSLAVREGMAGFTGWRGRLARWAYRNADVVVAQTDEMAVELRELMGVPGRSVRTIPNPVDERHIEESIRHAWSPFDASSGRVNIVAVGALTPRKGLDTLLEALARVRATRPAAVLWLVGADKADYRRELEVLAARLGIADAVMFAGFRDNPYPYMRWADLFVLSSRAEGLPNVLLEARYLGSRVVATDCVPVVSRIMGGRHVVPVGNAQRLAEEMLRALEEQPLPPLRGGSVQPFRDLFLGID